MNRRAAPTAVNDGGHDLMVTHPEALTHELLAAAAA